MSDDQIRSNSLFDKSKAEATFPSKSKPKSKDKMGVFDIEDLDKLTLISETIKKLTKVKNQIAEDIKRQGVRIFIREGMKKKARPDNFVGNDFYSTAVYQLKKMRSSSVLSTEDLEELDKNKIPYERVEETPEMFYFNNKVFEIEGALEKISDALASIEELRDVDVIKYEPAKIKYEISEASLDSLFSIENKSVVEKFTDKIMEITVTPKLKETFDPSIAVDIAKEALAIIEDNKDKE